MSKMRKGNKPKSKWRRKITKQEYIAVGKEHGLKLVGAVPKNVKEKTQWLCLRCKDKYHIRYCSLATSSLLGCQQCTRQILTDKKSLRSSAYKRLGQELGLRFIGEEPRCATSPVKWECKKCKEQFESPYASLRRAVNACKSCAKREKITALLRKLLVSYKIKPYSDIPSSPKESIKWTCRLGHVFKTSADNILQGRACAKCGRGKTSARQRKKPNDYKELGLSASCKWLGPIVCNIQQKTKWGCQKCAYLFDATFSALKRSGDCPKCKKCSTLETIKTDSSEYHIAARKYGWEWLGPETKNQHQLTNWSCPKRGHGEFLSNVVFEDFRRPPFSV